MKERIVYVCLLLSLCMAGPASRSLAQTITTGAFSPVSVCRGATVSVSFTVTGTFTTGNIFSAQLSNAGGTFPATPTVIGTAVNTARAISTIIPASVVAGAYKIRVVSTNPAQIGLVSTLTLTVNTPAEPGTAPLTYCVGQTAIPVTATAVTGAMLNWYKAASGGTASALAPTPSTETAGTQTYYVSQTLNGCESARTSLTVTVNGTPNPPTGTPPAPYCQGATATPLSATGQGLLWYGTDATGGTGSARATVPDTKTPGTQTYYVSQTVGGCESNRAGIAVVVKAAPDAPVTAPAPSYCQSQTAVALVATPATGGILNWYGTSATGGTSLTIASTPTTQQAGTQTYYVSQTINGCESVRAPIAVTVRPLPALPTVTNPTIACQNRTPISLTATPSASGTLNWYGTSATGGTASPTAPTPLVTALGNTTYYVSQSVNGCEGSRAPLVVTVNAVPAPPTAPAPSPYCQNAVTTALSATGQGLKWYGTNATGGTASPAAPTPPTSTVGTANYYVSQTVSGCESDRTAISVRVKETPARPGTAALELCQGSPASSLTATFAADATPSWYGTNPTGGLGSPNPPVPANTTVGTVTYYVGQTLDGCPSLRASLSVRVKALPGAPTVSPVSFCNNTPAQPLTAGGDSGSTLKWYSDADQLLSGTPTPSTNSVGNQVFKVAQTSNENCEGPKSTLTVTIKPTPNPPSVANLSYCQSQRDQTTQNVPALSAIGQNLRWFNPDGNAFPDAPTPSLDQAGTQTYQVSQTIDNCEGGKATVRVTINTTPAPTVARSLYTYCINERATPLQATPEAGASLRWVDPYERQTLEAPTPSTLNTNVNLDGDPFYVYQIGANGCYSARTTIRVLVNATPSLSLQAPTVNVNLGEKAPLRLMFTGTAPFSYTVTGGYSGVSRASDTTISVLPRGNTTYQVAAVTNACGVGLPGNPATAIITVRVPTLETSALTTATLCAGASLSVPFATTGQFNPGNTFRLELANAADTSRKYEVPAAAVGSPVTVSLPNTVPSGQYYVRAKASNPDVGIVGTNSPTLLTVRALPTATLTGTQNVLEGTPANLTVTFGGDGPWTLEYADSLRTYSAVATTSPYLAEVRPARTTTYRINSVANVCGTAPGSGSATVSVLTALGVEDDPLGSLVKAYPVPTTTVLTLELDVSLTRHPAVISLNDANGRPVLQRTTRSRRSELDLSNQPGGIYILHIRVGDRQTTRRVLKQ